MYTLHTGNCRSEFIPYTPNPFVWEAIALHLLRFYTSIVNQTASMAENYGTEVRANNLKAPKKWFRRVIQFWEQSKFSVQPSSHNRVSTWASNLSSTHIRIGAWATTLSKYLPAMGLSLTTVMSSILFGYINRPTYLNDKLYRFIDYNRASVQVILHILTTIFGFLHLYALTSVFNFATRMKLAKHATSLDRLKWWRAMSFNRIDFGLPMKYFVPALLFSGFATIPGILWTGALTPVLSTHLVPLEINVSRYAPDPDGNSWNQTWWPDAPHPVYRRKLGTFSYTPAFDRGESMVNTAAGVVYDKNRTKARSDKTGFTYTSRSHGVGASVGLVHTPLGQGYEKVFAYNYTEIGYDVKVSCEFNSSSQWITTLYEKQSARYTPNVYICKGATPDNAMDWYFQYTATNGSNIVCMDAHPEHVNPGGKGIVAIAAGQGSYLPLNNTQCNVTFAPTEFHVDVDLSAMSMDVKAQGPADDMDPTAQTNATYEAWSCNTLGGVFEELVTDCSNYTAQGQPGLGNIATRALRQLVDLSILDNSIHTSNIGEMFLSDAQFEAMDGSEISLDAGSSGVAVLNQSRNHGALIDSIEKALESLLDDSLFAFSSAQIILEHSTSTRNGNLTVGGISFGTKGYVYSLFAVNSVIVVIFLEELIRTKGWKRLSKFDYTDIKSVIIASSSGGSGIADTVVTEHKEHNDLWEADENDRIAGTIRVQLDPNGHQGITQLVQQKCKEHESGDFKGEKDRYEDSPLQGPGPWKSGPYVQLESTETSPYL